MNAQRSRKRLVAALAATAFTGLVANIGGAALAWRYRTPLSLNDALNWVFEGGAVLLALSSAAATLMYVVNHYAFSRYRWVIGIIAGIAAFIVVGSISLLWPWLVVPPYTPVSQL
jgi:hypothetical protein